MNFDPVVTNRTAISRFVPPKAANSEFDESL
jgi:hypothetical protein